MRSAAGENGAPTSIMLTWIAIVWLACFAAFLEFAHRASG